MNCLRCNTALSPDQHSCPKCGSDVSAAGTVPIDTDATVKHQPTETGQFAALHGQLQQIVGDRYEIQNMLGRGGMGAVFLARERKLDRLVAIKVLPPGMSFDEQFTVRFVREARTAAQLDHPNIVPIYSVEDEGDLLFFVMKYVTGHDLTHEIRNNPFDAKRAQKLLWEAACALGHAHQRGVIHRDVKPGNIMIDEAGRPMLTDFGISKAASTSETQFTVTGQMIGTPTYISPEQAKGLAVDGRTDQYALGVVGYQMLSGRVPFDDESVHSLIYKQIFMDPEPLKTVRPDCPDHLAEAIHHALQKEPRARFDTMEEFATAVWPENPVTATKPPKLHNISIHDDTDTPTGTQETPVLAGTARKNRANRPLMIGSGVVATLVVGFGGWMMTKSEPDTPPPPTVAVVAPGALAAAESSDALTEPLTTEPSPTDLTPNETATPRTNTPSAAARVTPPAATTQATGFLSVGARPWGTVYINGVELRNTPVTNHALPPGQYVIEVRRIGYTTVVDTVDITAGNPTRANYVLIPGQ